MNNSNTRKPAAVEVKFGAAEGTLGYGRSISLLARRGSGEWERVGWVDVEADTLDPYSRCDADLRVCGYDAKLRLDEPYSPPLPLLVYKRSVPVMMTAGGWSYRMRSIRTPAEAKRMVKAWAAETLESVGWGL